MIICDLHAELDDTHDRVTLVLAGPIDQAGVRRLADCVLDALRSGAYEIDLDLSHVPSMVHEALDVLRGAREMVDSVGGYLCLRNPTPPVMEVLAVGAFA